MIKREINGGIFAPAEIVSKVEDIINRKMYRAGLGELFDVLISWMSLSDKEFVRKRQNIRRAVSKTPPDQWRL